MKIKHYLKLTLVPVLLSTPLPLLAGTLNSPAVPNDAMCTLDDIWDRLKGNTTDIPTASSFNEPTSGPGSTMHTLTEICTELDTVMDAIPSNPAPVPATGESGSTGVAWPNPRFTNNNDGTVTDNLTGLIWLKNANCTDTLGGIDPTASSNKLTWANAQTWTVALASSSCGLSDNSSAGDWRLPSVNELQSLISYSFFNPALSNAAGTGQWTEGDAFSGVQTSNYWSSTSNASNTANAWYVYLGFGRVGVFAKGNASYIWPVRGGQFVLVH